MTKKMGSYVSLVVMFALGLILILNPGWVIHTGIRLVGVALLIFGAGAIITNLLQHEFKLTNTAGLLGNVIIAIIGLILIFNAGAVTHLFNVIFGAIIVVHGVTLLIGALDNKEVSVKSYVPAIIAAVIILFGVLILLRVFRVEEIMLRVAGIVMLFNAALGLWVALKK